MSPTEDRLLAVFGCVRACFGRLPLPKGIKQRSGRAPDPASKERP